MYNVMYVHVHVHSCGKVNRHSPVCKDFLINKFDVIVGIVFQNIRILTSCDFEMLEIGINHHLDMNATQFQNFKLLIFWYIMKMKKDVQNISSQRVLELSKV
jgi:hypothetical protein